MPTATTSRGPIEYRRLGRGPLVVVLKGGHSSRDTRLGHERLVDEGFSVLEVSRPGYDATPPSTGRSAQLAAGAIAELLASLDVHGASLVVISAAGHTGIELARRHPDRIARVSFESAVSLPWDARTRRGGRILFGPGQALLWAVTRLGLRVAPDATLRIELSAISSLPAGEVVRSLAPETRAQLIALYRSLSSGRGFVLDLGHDSPGDARLLQPALILHGAHDPSVPPAHADRLAVLCPRHERLTVDAESHFIWLGRAAEEVWSRRLQFLRAEAY